MLKVIDKIIKKTKHKFEFIDLGGGMGIDYDIIIKINYKNIILLLKNF